MLVLCQAQAQTKSQVVISDYPAPAILDTLWHNITENLTREFEKHVRIQGHIWGELDSSFALSYAHHFTRVIAADCLWMSHEHTNFLKSMSHFLSLEARARVYVIAGFHTGREKIASFFQDAVSASDFTIELIWECDNDGRRRDWDPMRPEEDAGKRKKWLVVAVLRRADR